jgi:hypothetical protein
LRLNGIDFFFYSAEHRPIHVHVRSGGARAKVKIEDGVEIIEASGFSPRSLKSIKKFCMEEAEYITKEWEVYFDV